MAEMDQVKWREQIKWKKKRKRKKKERKKKNCIFGKINYISVMSFINRYKIGIFLYHACEDHDKEQWALHYKHYKQHENIIKNMSKEIQYEVHTFWKHKLHCKTALKYLGGRCIFIAIEIDSPCGCVIHLFQICPEDTSDIISLRNMRPFLVVFTASDEQRTACLQIQQMWFLCCNAVRWEW